MAKRAMEEAWERGYSSVDGGLCLDHISDRPLRDRLETLVTLNSCDVCGRKDQDSAPFAAAFDELSAIVSETVDYFFRNAEHTLPWDSEEKGPIGPTSDTAEVLDSITDGAFSDDHRDAIYFKLVEAFGDHRMWTPWDAEADDVDSIEWQWEEYAELSKHQSRLPYTTGNPSDPPSRLLNYLERIRQYASVDLDLVRELPVDSRLFRGRLCEDPKKIKPTAADLGPAPEGKATANRMSNAGVSLFYGSEEPETAVAEIASHGVEPYALIGEFFTTRSLRILDFTADPAIPSPFDLEKRDAALMGRFIRVFVQMLTIPVIPDGRQHIEYAPTQLLTEYLRWAVDPRIEGIALPSARSDSKETKKTFVLFLGPRDCATLGDVTPEPDSANDFLFDLKPGEDTAASLKLTPETVVLWEVQRSVKATPAPPWLQPTGPTVLAALAAAALEEIPGTEG